MKRRSKGTQLAIDILRVFRAGDPLLEMSNTGMALALGKFLTHSDVVSRMSQLHDMGLLEALPREDGKVPYRLSPYGELILKRRDWEEIVSLGDKAIAQVYKDRARAMAAEKRVWRGLGGRASREAMDAVLYT